LKEAIYAASTETFCNRLLDYDFPQ